MKFSSINLWIMLLLVFQQGLFAQQIQQWQQVSNDGGIQVYTINMPNTDIVKAKAIAEIKSPLIRVRQELDDIDSRHEWVPFLKQSKLIIVNSATRRLEYSLFAAPWPASNRDFVYSLQLVKESSDQLVYKIHSVITNAMPEKDKLIRGEIFESIYTLTKINENLTRVELSYHADPKGWLPSWIVNIIQRVLPYKILRNLRQRLEEPAE
jgi:START domain